MDYRKKKILIQQSMNKMCSLLFTSGRDFWACVWNGWAETTPNLLHGFISKKNTEPGPTLYFYFLEELLSDLSSIKAF
jgi:hypothetical protein